MTNSAPLTDEVLTALKTLIAMNVDSVKGYAEAATLTSDADLEALFREIAESRRHNVAELGKYVAAHGETPDTSGTLIAATHRMWMDLRALVEKNDRHAVLTEVTRGEKTIRDAYMSLIDDTSAASITEQLRRQYHEVITQYERVAALLKITEDWS